MIDFREIFLKLSRSNWECTFLLCVIS